MKTLSGIFFVAATCIGSGMIALPIAFAKVGLIPSTLAMIFLWLIIYHTSLVNLELNLQAGKGLGLSSLCKLFSGKKSEMISILSLNILLYSLLAAFISGSSSIIGELVETTNLNIKLWYTFGIAFVLTLPSKLVRNINNILFLGLISIVGILVFCLMLTVNWANVPLIADDWTNFSSWHSILPILFTSFGFQVIFHTLTDACNKDAKVLNKVFLFGSLVPAIIYMIWNCSVLGALYNNAPDFYEKMTLQRVEVGELVQHLSLIAKVETIQLLIWWIVILAIVTSVIGISLGLMGMIDHQLVKSVKNILMRHLLSVTMTVLPAYLMLIFVPNIFIGALSFAGMILSIIAIILPIYLLNCIKEKSFNYHLLNNRTLIYVSLFVGVFVVFCEILNII